MAITSFPHEAYRRFKPIKAHKKSGWEKAVRIIYWSSFIVHTTATHISFKTLSKIYWAHFILFYRKKGPKFEIKHKTQPAKKSCCNLLEVNDGGSRKKKFHPYSISIARPLTHNYGLSFLGWKTIKPSILSACSFLSLIDVAVISNGFFTTIMTKSKTIFLSISSILCISIVFFRVCVCFVRETLIHFWRRHKTKRIALLLFFFFLHLLTAFIYVRIVMQQHSPIWLAWWFSAMLCCALSVQCNTSNWIYTLKCVAMWRQVKSKRKQKMAI